MHNVPPPNTPMCDHKSYLSMYALTVKAGSWGTAFAREMEVRKGMSWTFPLTKHTSTSLWTCQQPDRDVENVSHFLSFYSKGLISELILCRLTGRQPTAKYSCGRCTWIYYEYIWPLLNRPLFLFRRRCNLKKLLMIPCRHVFFLL